jgi:hypothetical protein
MIEQHQTTFGTNKSGDSREPGNCFATAIACILEIALDEIPNFCAYEDWFERANQWLNERGLCYLEFGIGTEQEFWAGFTGYCILVGDSPRGCKHAVVGYKAKMVHDPHPSGEGLVTTDRIGFFIPIQPKIEAKR